MTAEIINLRPNPDVQRIIDLELASLRAQAAASTERKSPALIGHAHVYGSAGVVWINTEAVMNVEQALEFARKIVMAAHNAKSSTPTPDDVA